ncbi:cytochrome P450 [Pseudofrankia asymbiotica]|uniref:Cytochrome n=1 Tax=Pseudofrankia asymbiotica TaxID=1834516 RepID=A0A1V2IF89_9ACTN|nr:cytochrome P450 [Pseudofrankia asymbiotica]ONH31725.1 hypothetical protein BL253_08690 [Pseudofrankia asymbiotica]
MDLDEYRDHLPPLLPPEDAHAASRLLLERRPVAHSDQDGGFWIVNRYADFVRVMQDSASYETGTRGVYVPTLPVDRPAMPPLEYNGPRHHKIKEVMSRYFSPKSLARFEDRFRGIIGGMIDEFAADGHCDLAQQLSKRYPAQIICEVLLGVSDPAEVRQLSRWVRELTYDMTRLEPAVLKASQAQWRDWCARLVQARRAEPQDDIVSQLLALDLDDAGERLDDGEIVGAIQLLLFAGFGTTSDATSNVVIRLIEEPGLEDLLRADPTKISIAIEETLRLDPPVTTRPRRPFDDVEFDGQTIPAGSRILCNYLAANLDPDEWDDPDAFRMDRKRNRAVTFGIGEHRCSGSHMARIELRIMVEELLKRVTDIRWAGDAHEERVSFLATVWRGVDSLPVVFTPLAPAAAVTAPAGSAG